MKKPKDLSEYTWVNDEGINIFPPYFYFEEIPKLIEWLQSVQKYHEFKSKKNKVKK